MRSRVVMSNAWGSGKVVHSGVTSAGGLEEESRYAGADSDNQVRLSNYTLSPRRCVGSEEPDEESEPLEEFFPKLVKHLSHEMDATRHPSESIRESLSEMALDAIDDAT